ncbi:MAG TPA: hypothetical protein VGG27_01305 [Magnetospirillaceae bacterium]|jgi:hypothetical protein
MLVKTFGGLSRPYYLRHFLFGLIFPALFIWNGIHKPQTLDVGLCVLMVVNTLLYPYSRFVYESIMRFIIGDNVFFVRPLFMVAMKFFTMLACWGLAIFIAPLGLAYLYYRHTKDERSAAALQGQ